MTIRAELEFITNAREAANEAAPAIARLRGELEQLGALNGTRVSLGADYAAQLGEAAQHAATIAEIEAKSAAKLAEIQARSEATLAQIEARRISSEQAATASIAEIQAKAESNITAIQAKSEATLAAHAAKATADVASSEARMREQWQRDHNAIIIAGAKASHEQMAAEQAHRHKMAELELKGAQDAAKIRLKGEQDRQRDAARAAARQATQTARGAGGGAGVGGRLANAGQALVQGGGLQGAASALGGAAGALTGAAVAVTTALGGAVIEGGKLAIQAAEFRRNALIGLEKMLGGAEQAQAAYKQIQTIANVTPFETTDVKRFYQTLLGGLKDTERTERALKAVSDVAALNEFDTDKAFRMSEALAKMAGQGKLTTETLNQLGEASGGIVSRADIYEALAESTGKAAGDIQKEIEKGKIDAAKGYDAIVDVIEKRVSGGKVGDLAKQLGEQSVTGLVSTIRGVGFELLSQTNIDPIIKSLKVVADQLQGPAGERLGKATSQFFTNLFEATFGPLGDSDGPERIEKMINRVSETVEKAGKVVKDATPIFDAFGKTLLVLGGGEADTPADKRIKGVINLVSELAGMMNVVGRLYDFKIGPLGIIQSLLDIAGIDVDLSPVQKWVDAFLNLVSPKGILRHLSAMWSGDMSQLGADDQNPIIQGIRSLLGADQLKAAVDSMGWAGIGKAITDGIVQGIVSGVQGVKDAAVSAARAAYEGATGFLKTGSPSRLFEDEVGYQTTAGQAIGMVAGIPMVEAAANDVADAAYRAATTEPWPMAMPAQMANAGAANAGAAPMEQAPIFQFTFGDIIISGAGKTSDEIGDEFEAVLEERVQRVAERMWLRMANGGG